MFEYVLFTIFLFGTILGCAWLVARAIFSNDKHDNFVLYPIINWRKLMTPPCYQCKHCIYISNEQSFMVKPKKILCDKKSAVNYYERLCNDAIAGVEPDYIRGTKYCEFKKNKNLFNSPKEK